MSIHSFGIYNQQAFFSELKKKFISQPAIKLGLGTRVGDLKELTFSCPEQCEKSVNTLEADQAAEALPMAAYKESNVRSLRKDCFRVESLCLS